MDDIVLHSSGTSDLAAELDLYAAQVSTQLRAARNYRLLINDKTEVQGLPIGHAREITLTNKFVPLAGVGGPAPLIG
jgi:hypothetical protein